MLTCLSQFLGTHPGAGVEDIADAVAEEVEGEHRQQDRRRRHGPHGARGRYASVIPALDFARGETAAVPPVPPKDERLDNDCIILVR